MRGRDLALVAALVALVVLALLLLRAPRRDEERPSSVSVAEPVQAADAPAHSTERDDTAVAARAQLPEIPPVAQVAPASEEAPAPEEPLRLRLDGRVVDLEDRPIAGAEVRLSDDALVATSGADGAFEAELALGPDSPLLRFFDPELEIHVSSPARRSAYRRFEVRDATVVHVGTLRLGAGGDVTGRVLDEAGSPLADAWVGWRDAGAWPADEEEARREGVGFLRDSDDAQPEIWTDAEGRFRLRGLPEGEFFLVANDEERLFSWSDVFTLRAGETVERTLVLARDPRYSSVRGRVLDPERRAAAGARVGIVERSGAEVEASGDFVVDESGNFEVLTWSEGPQQAPLELVAWDPLQRWYPSEITLVQGAGPVELVLAPARHLELRMTDADGAPIGWGHARFLGRGWDPTRARELVPLGREGKARVLRPREPFQVEAMAPGWRTVKLGPFDAESAPDPLVLVMTPGDAVRGRVIAAGHPLAGARIGIERTHDPSRLGRSWSLAPLDRAFTTRGEVHGQPDDATTGPDGRFTLTLHSDGWHVVLVAAKGFPVTFFGPFEWTRGAAIPEIELALEPAGAIEGRVLVAPGVDPAGRIAGASNGWGIAWTAVAEADGRFRIDGLAPGPYQVRPCLPPASSQQTYNARLRDDGAPMLELVWDCEVRAGEVTHHDLDLRDEELFVLAGRFTSGAEPAGRFIRLFEPGSSFPLAMQRREADGSFELRLSRGGSLVLDLSGRFRRPIELAPGRTEWSAEIPSATLELTGALPPDPDGRERWAAYRWRGADDLEFQSGWYSPSFQRPFVEPVPAGPAGKGELVWVRDGDARGEPTVLQALELEPGARAVVNLTQLR